MDSKSDNYTFANENTRFNFEICIIYMQCNSGNISLSFQIFKPCSLVASVY